MSQSVEVVGCRVVRRPDRELWDVCDQLSIDACIQLPSIQSCELPALLH